MERLRIHAVTDNPMDRVRDRVLFLWYYIAGYVEGRARVPKEAKACRNRFEIKIEYINHCKCFKMKFSCTNLRKNGELTLNSFDGNELKVSRVYTFGASLTEEYAQVFMILDVKFRNRGFLHFKSPSWLSGISDDTEDEEAVNALNKKISDRFPGSQSCTNDLELEARVHKTTMMSVVYFRDTEILSPSAVYHRPLSEVEVIFCERVTSYTKTFDLSIVFKDKRVETHSCMSRKRLKDVEAWAEKRGIELYQTGPDPLTWKTMFACRETETWKEIDGRLNYVSSEEEEESEWEQGLTDPESESEAFTDTGTESECDLFEELPKDENKDYAIGKKRVWYDSDDEPSKRVKL